MLFYYLAQFNLRVTLKIKIDPIIFTLRKLRKKKFNLEKKIQKQLTNLFKTIYRSCN